MEKNKICPICGEAFKTTQNAQRFCSADCRKGKPRKETTEETVSPFICEWCGEIFYAEKKRKYCDAACRSMATADRLKKKKQKSHIEPEMSIEEINELARKENLSYGKYCAKHGLY